jgi:hypothetical protein
MQNLPSRRINQHNVRVVQRAGLNNELRRHSIAFGFLNPFPLK